MSSNIDAYKAELEALVKKGSGMNLDLAYRHPDTQEQLDKKGKALGKKVHGKFESEYQRWFTEASAVVRQLLPDRSAEFNELYKGEGKRKAINSNNYNIQDWLNGIRASKNSLTQAKFYDDLAIVSMRFLTQTQILESAEARFESSLTDIRQIVQADLFDSELEAARELLKCGFDRAAGAVAGVVLEKHLGQVAAHHNVTTRKKHPTISDFNDLLKKGSVLDVPTWRQIQRLSDIRNLCDHNKDRDPTEDEVTELIDGVEKVTKTLF